MTQQCIKAIIRGRVQGVFFRDSTRSQALQLNITGYAKNLSDGTVEVIACGKMEQLEQLVEWLHHGPEYAHVTQVSVSPLPIKPTSSFLIG